MMHALRTALPALAAFSMALAPTAALANAPDWNVSRAQSEVTFSGTHAGRAFNGEFSLWTARIRFAANDLPNSRIIVVIQTDSASTGDATQTRTLKNAEWFGVAAHPTATFASNNITARGGNRYVANGTLTIKGRAAPVELPFTVDINGRNARASGSLTLDRIRLGMGTESDPQAQWVSRNIELKFSINAARS